MLADALQRLGNIKIAAIASIGVAASVMALKYVAYLWTGSVALYSDALESIVNLVTALAALYAIHVSSQPADRQHQFGHHKAEYFSAVLEGVLIVVAALMINALAGQAGGATGVSFMGGLANLIARTVCCLRADYSGLLPAPQASWNPPIYGVSREREVIGAPCTVPSETRVGDLLTQPGLETTIRDRFDQALAFLLRPAGRF